MSTLSKELSILSFAEGDHAKGKLLRILTQTKYSLASQQHTIPILAKRFLRNKQENQMKSKNQSTASFQQ